MAASPFLGQIQPFGFSFAPVGWLPCDGSTLSISEYDNLYKLIGTTYGGNGTTTFALPDLRGRVPVGMGQGIGLNNYAIGETGGAETVVLTTDNMPIHQHLLSGNSGTFGVSSQPGVLPAPIDGNTTIGATSGGIPNNAYTAANPDILLNVGPNNGVTVQSAGNNAPFNTMAPYFTITYCIAVLGEYPQKG